jgi:hypothetical protein
MKIRFVSVLLFLFVAPVFCLAQAQDIINQAKKES